MYDGSTQIFERIRHIDGAFVVACTPDNQIIITHQEQPLRPIFISLPGGTIETDEDPLFWAKRELLEETGYISDEFIHWKTTDYNMSVVSFCDYYIARNCQHIQDIAPDSGEKIALKMISFDEFLLLSEDSHFQHRDISDELFLARLYPQKKEHLRKMFFWEV